MRNRVQIVVMHKGETRWKFIAHGAPYTREEAEDFKARYFGRAKVRFLPVGKEKA